LRRTGATIDTAGDYLLDLLDQRYRICPARQTIAGPAGQADEHAGSAGRPPDEVAVVLLGYLTHAAEAPFTGKWISASSLPGGDLFFRGPHALPVEPVVRRFRDDPAALSRTGQALGGTLPGFGDVSIALRPLPRVMLAVVMWSGDEEFEARGAFLFDSSMAGRYPLDMILALTGVVARRLVAAG
jgi:hypothetical protein